MKKITILLIALGFSLLSACAMTPTDDIKIVSESDPKVNFSGYKSYAWLGSVEVLNDPNGQWKKPGFDVDTEIRFLIDRELRGRGLSEKTDKPDMIVAYAMGVNMDALQVKENPETKVKMLKNVPKGALMIMIIDPETKFVMWVGAAKAEVQKSADKAVIKARLDYAVTKMLGKMPK